MYKTVPKTQPGVAGGGQIKYYASIVRDRPVNLRKFASEISAKCTLNTGDVFAVLELFLQQLDYHMEDGRVIKLGDLGTFSPSLHSNGELTPEKVSSVNISNYRVVFKPSAYLADRLSRVKFEKMSNGTSTDVAE
jgi:predicted histone-like DNA-binding protein